MRSHLLKLFALAVLGTLPIVASANSSKQEAAGVGAGGLIGAAAGGPVGFIIGAALGAKLGDTWHRRNVQIDNLDAALTDAGNQKVALQQQLNRADTNLDTAVGQLNQLQQQVKPSVALLQAGITMDLLFRTDEHVLTDATAKRLARLGSVVAAMPNVDLQLDGYADERGTDKHNLDLSQQRVEYIRDQLLAAGIDSARIHVAAHGETPASDTSSDSLALDRRVSLTLSLGEQPDLAASAN